MNEIIIHALPKTEEIPWNLLLSADPLKEQIETYIHSGKIYVVSKDEAIIGVLVIEKSNGIVEIKNVAVTETFQGKGIGKQLVLYAIETAKRLGATKITVGTGNSSLNQLALYQKCGFRIVGVENDFFTKHYPEKIIENGIVCRDMVKLEQAL